MTNPTPGPLAPGSTIGIIGGGQLGRMLAMAAARLGYRTVILDPADYPPAAQLTNTTIKAAYDDPSALAELARLCDVITYEFENVPTPGLATIADRVPVWPPIRALETAQDRLVEKEFLTGLGLDTAPFAAAGSQNELGVAVAAVGGRAVIKTRRFGYDGKGQMVVTGTVPPDAYEALGGVPLLVEGLIDFLAEVSVIGVRAASGEIRLYDPAVNEHSNGILARSTVACGVSGDATDAVAEATEAILAGLDYVGVIGVEFFLASDGRVLVNEFAPRVHNSGHWTEAACLVSQFEQHVRAIVGLPLGSTDRHRSVEMVNLIGECDAETAELLADGGWLVHLYGKAEARPGRKMGHATRLL